MLLLAPTTALNQKNQKEDVNQVDVLFTMFELRLAVLDCNQPLQCYDLTRQNRAFYHPTQLHPLVKKMHQLAERFTKNFFSRYTGHAIMRKTSYMSEVQVLLHPHVKAPEGALAKMVRLCSEQQRVGAS
ncbi:hypothetical protein BBJ28_00020326 [Nothophytophthora sp. Chile5]|nr:hypothetical protein BBJ28_00020326 [Nothophytophthora sp. Chile5]